MQFGATVIFDFVNGIEWKIFPCAKRNLSQNHVLLVCFAKIVPTFKAKFIIFINHTR